MAACGGLGNQPNGLDGWQSDPVLVDFWALWRKRMRRTFPFLIVFGLGPAILVLMLTLVLSLIPPSNPARMSLPGASTKT